MLNIRQKKGFATRKTSLLVLPAFCFVLCICQTNFGALPNEVESWNDISFANWKRQDTLNGNNLSLICTGNVLTIAFSVQAMSQPQVDLVYADTSSSGGKFTGNYKDADVAAVCFKFYCKNTLPAQARLYLYNTESGNMWYYPMQNLKTGQWIECFIPMDYGEGWHLSMDPTNEKFKQDQTAVSLIGIRLQRNGWEEEVYAIDDFMLVTSDQLQYTSDGIPCWWLEKYFSDATIDEIPPDTAPGSYDSDNDGMSNYAEYLAGTDPNSATSLLQVEMDKNKKDKNIDEAGATLRWKSSANRMYEVWRTDNLMDEFILIDSNITGTPPENTYVDTTATDSGPYFYRIKTYKP